MFGETNVDAILAEIEACKKHTRTIMFVCWALTTLPSLLVQRWLFTAASLFKYAG